MLALLSLCFSSCATTGNVSEEDYATLLETSLQDKTELDIYRNLYYCVLQMYTGEFENAKVYCNIAGSVNPHHPEYLKTIQMVQDGLTEKNNIDDSFESNAENSSSSKSKASNQAKKSHVNVDDLCKQAATAIVKEKDDCKAFALYAEAFQVGGANAACTRLGKAHLKQFAKTCKGSSHVNIEQIEMHNEEVDELCKAAAAAKLKDKDNCEAYRLYKEAFKIGGVKAACRRMGEKHIEHFEDQCF